MVLYVDIYIHSQWCCSEVQVASNVPHHGRDGSQQHSESWTLIGQLLPTVSHDVISVAQQNVLCLSELHNLTHVRP